MKALLSHQAGGPDSLRLEEIADPVPASDEILIRVIACGVNFPDVLMVADKYQFRPPRPFAPGAEVSGVVEQVGSEVTEFAVGDRVMAICSWGGMAEKLTISPTKCVLMSDAMPFDDGATFLLTYGTAHYALAVSGQLQAGQTLLVLGAAGGVGLAAVELGKAIGARVVAAVSSEEKAAIARQAGADEVVIYPSGPLDRAAKRELTAAFCSACAGGADVVADPVGGDYSEAALRAMRPGGRFAVIGFAAGVGSIPMNVLLFSEASVVAAAWGAVVAKNPAQYKSVARELIDLYQKGLVRPHISQKFPLGLAGEALKVMEGRKALGKIVIEVAD